MYNLIYTHKQRKITPFFSLWWSKRKELFRNNAAQKSKGKKKQINTPQETYIEQWKTRKKSIIAL